MPRDLPVKKSPESFLPLSQTNYYILVSLLGGNKHGYAIHQDIERLSGQTVFTAIGNLYVALQHLLIQGLIEQVEEAELGSKQGKVRRKVYRLSTLGERVLKAEIERMRHMLQAADLGR
jgi:DNA-binding PadR family transcriptional regulator